MRRTWSSATQAVTQTMTAEKAESNRNGSHLERCSARIEPRGPSLYGGHPATRCALQKALRGLPACGRERRDKPSIGASAAAPADGRESARAIQGIGWM